MFATSSYVDAAKSVLDCQKYVFGNIVPNTNFWHDHAKSLYLGLEYSNKTINISNITSSPRKKRTLQNTEERKQNKQKGSGERDQNNNTNNTKAHSCSRPMPRATQSQSTSWGKQDKASLHALIIEGKVDIKDTSFRNIDSVQARYFPHRTVHNFRCNFKDFSSVFNLDKELEGARVRAAQYEEGKMNVCFESIILFKLLYTLTLLSSSAHPLLTTFQATTSTPTTTRPSSSTKTKRTT